MAQRHETTSQANLMITFYERKFLESQKTAVRMYQLAEKKPLPKAHGDNIEFKRYLPLNLITSSLAASSLTAGQQDFSVQEITATLAEYGGWVSYTKHLSDTSLDPNLMKLSELHGEQAGKSIDYFLQREVGFQGNYGARVDTEADAEQRFTANASTGASTTHIMFFDGAVTGTAHITNGTHICCYEGTNYGWAGIVDETCGATGLSVLPAAPAAFDATSKLRLCSSTNLAATDVISASGIRKAVAALKTNGALPLDRSFYTGVVGYDVASDLMADSVWQNAKTYSDVADLYNGYLGSLYGVHFIETGQPLREDELSGTALVPVGGNYSSIDMSDGYKYHNFLCGKMAFASIELGGEGSKVIRTPPGGNGDPLERGGSVGWKVDFVSKSLNANWVVDLLSSATGATKAAAS